MANERGSLEVAEVSSTLPRRRRRAQEWCHRAPGEKLHPDGLARASAIGQRRPDVLLFFFFSIYFLFIFCFSFFYYFSASFLFLFIFCLFLFFFFSFLFYLLHALISLSRKTMTHLFFIFLVLFCLWL